MFQYPPYIILYVYRATKSPASERIQGKMKQMLKSRLANKFNIDMENPILGREVEWYMANRETSYV